MNSELLDIADRIRCAHVKHESELGQKDQEILQLKLQLNDFKNTDLEIEPTNSNYGDTASQQLEALKMENQSLRRLGTERSWRIDELKSQLLQSQSEGTLTDWLQEKSEFEDQIELLKDQTRAHQSQVQQYMSAWKREQQLREDVKAKLDAEQRHVVKLDKELKKAVEELKIERMEGTRERYLRLRSAVSGLMAFEQIKGMATETFGDVGRAMKRLKDLITEEAAQKNDAGSWR
jgi:chromosome segregation ATPase